MEQASPDRSNGSSETLIFVYGTSMSGEPNHGLMTGARFVSEACTLAEFDLVDLGGFPAMVHGGETKVNGELYSITRVGVQFMDEVEDHPEYFRRTAVKLEDGQQVHSYLLPASQGRPFPRICSGNWRNR
ncbi:MAG: gamma-glutamylaminecyclotransferase [Candidatus Paceibacteria bacterium]|jgi:gamma-glutamylaminecyclotransferase